MGEAVAEEVAGEVDVLPAVGLNQVEAALLVPLQGLQAAGGLGGVQRGGAEGVEAEAVAELGVHVAQDVEGVERAEVERGVAAQHAVVEADDVEADHQVGALQVGQQRLDVVLEVGGMGLLVAVPDDAEGHAHEVGAVPAADGGGAALGFEVEHHQARALWGRLLRGGFGGFPGRENGRLVGVFDDWPAAEMQAFAARQPLQQMDAARLVQRHVAGAAGGKMDARRAAALAIAGFNQAEGHVQQPVEHLEAFLGQADAAGVVVVDEDGPLAQLRVQRVADAADVGAVAQRQKRVQGLHGVLDGVD